jgi:hypothetical protein
MWTYVYLSAYLGIKDKTALTGLESYIVSRQAQQATDFIPIGLATVIKP